MRIARTVTHGPSMPFISIALAIAVVWAIGYGVSAESGKPSSASKPAAQSTATQDPIDMYNSRHPITPQKRAEAAARLAAARAAGSTTAVPKAMNLAATGMNPRGVPDYFGVPNYANSPLPVLDPVSGLITGGIRKFVDSLPGLGAASANNLGQFIPVAVPDTVTYPGSDYYEINLVQYTEKMHSDLPPTTLRGYVQVNNGTDPAVASPTPANNTIAPAPVHYLGPLILSRANRPVRVKFTNMLPPGTGGNLFIPTDTTAMGAGLGPDGVTSYGQNRATLHLHGGNTPWVSDGTPHQWTVPQGDTSPFQKGASAQDVPDMPPSGQGQLTFYWTNQQSARLMFYHDHAYGITRLNVYAGEAAGYLITDPVEQDLISGTNTSGANAPLAKVLPDLGIPLVIQDKTFVPDTTPTPRFPAVGGQLAATDPTWDTASWGGLGNLWYPHVYTPNQNPADLGGANAYGRWDYGPWFWPPIDPTTLKVGPILISPGVYIPGTPNPSLTPEAFMDTPVVNGTAYPFVQVQPKTYRFRILNAANDRTLNLQLYYADGSGGAGAAATATVTAGSVSAVTLSSGGSGYLFPPTVYFLGGGGTGALATTTIAGGVVTAITLVNGGSGYTSAPRIMVGSTKEVRMVPAVPPGTLANPLPPCPTGVLTGVPTLYTAGTPYAGGACWPATWPVDGRDGGVPDPATVGPNMIQIGTEGGFLKQPVILDNTPVGYEYNRRSITVLNVANKTLMLGPAERADVLVDFSSVPPGSTLILYNDAPAPVPAFDPRLDYYTGNVDQSDTGSPTMSPGGASGMTGGAPSTLPEYGPNTRTVMQIRVVAGTPTPYGQMAALTTALASAWAATQPAHVVPQAIDGAATDTYSRIQDTSITFTPLGSATPTTLPMQPKAIQELFELDYGRMNATLGVELPFTNFNIQTTIPLGYKDPLTETWTNGQPAVWKITHNGVDTHFVHFHLTDVQVINRIGWDGAVKPPDANEVGWKETIRMNPLEDIVVAMRPTAAALPFGVPESNRPLDPTMPVGASLTLTNPVDGNPITVPNAITNFGWEYVWHCHILGHEENDMMRPINFSVTVVPPGAPTAVAALTSGSQVTVLWQDPTPPPASMGNPANEIGFRVERSTDAGATWGTAGTAPANATLYRETGTAPFTNYRYRVVAYNAAGSATSTVASPAAALPGAPTAPVLSGTATSRTVVTLTWTGVSANTTGFEIQRSTGTGFVVVATAGNVTTFADTVTPGTTYTYQIVALNQTTVPALRSPTSNTVVVTPPAGAIIGLTDLDGDGKGDPLVWQPATGMWSGLTSGTAYAGAVNVSWGASGDTPVAADYDGDRRTDLAIWRPSTGTWYVLQSSNGYNPALALAIGWGASTDIPMPGDYDGDAKADICVYRPSTGTWFLLKSSTGYNVASYQAYGWGAAGDVPVSGDFDGDGRMDIAVYRPSTGTWFILTSSTGYNPASYLAIQWGGAADDVPVAADYDGDGKTDIGVYRQSTGTWYLLLSTTGYNPASSTAVSWGGGAGDVPLPNDWDGDLKADLVIWRPTNNNWYVLKSSSNYTAYLATLLGSAGAVPVYVK